MKPALSNLMKASIAVVAGWTFAAWLLFLLITAVASVTQA
jgi:hypothetical protein